MAISLSSCSGARSEPLVMPSGKPGNGILGLVLLLRFQHSLQLGKGIERRGR